MADDRYAFIYSDRLDDTFINFYDKVVVEADEVDSIYAKRYPDRMVAYISIGEIEPWRGKRYRDSWVISKNLVWKSLVADMSSRGYQNFLLKRADELYKKGYRNFFLDTVDVYNRISDKRVRKLVQDGAVEFIERLRREYPDAKIIINRGFEILDRVYRYVDAVAVESLISGYDHSKKIYKKVPKRDREWILNHLKRAEKLGLDVISIDYSNKGSDRRREIAKEIRELGVIPYVTDGLLQEQGECDIKREKRDILILYNKSILKNGDSIYSNAHKIISMPLEHLGYIPILYDISTKPLPKNIDRFHSVIIWSRGKTKNDNKILDWTRQIIKSGKKVLFIDNFVFNRDNDNLKFFSLRVEKNRNSLFSKSKTVYIKPFSAYEIEASIRDIDNILTSNSQNIKPIIYLEYENSQKYIAVGVAPWGGYSEKDSILLTIGDKYFWTIDPFKFLKETLNLNLETIPDPTTEGGRREFFISIDGENSTQNNELESTKIAFNNLKDKIFSKYKIPQSILNLEEMLNKKTPWIEYIDDRKNLIKNIYTTVSKENPLKSLIRPFGIKRDRYWQIYTNRWSIYAWNYKNIIETFKLTDIPRRLKPIDIYYPLNLGLNPTYIKQIDSLYRWAISQNSSKIYTSDYIKKIKDFYRTSIAKLSDKTYEIRNGGYLRTLRVDKNIFIDLENSIGVAGFNHTNGKTYITLDRRYKHIVKLTDKKPKVPYLIDLDGWVEKYSSNKFILKSYTKLNANFYIPKGCQISKIPKWLNRKVDKDRIYIYSPKVIGGATIEFECK